ncbi:MAG: serine protease, partial [Thermus sp.]
MGKIWLPLLAALALALSACTQQAPGGASLQVQGASGKARYLVVFKSETLPANAPTWAEGAGARVLRVLEPIGTLVVLADPGTASRLAKHPEVLAVGREGRYTL